ncbi:MAG: LCP family protein [Clostridia bacterium]|nr:LCP family protein [Clostridia bacterium]
MLQGFRNFILTFVISLAIFGIIAYFVVQLVLGAISADTPVINNGPLQTGGEDYVENTGNDALEELDGNSFNMLFLGLDYAPDIFYDYYDPNTADKLVEYDGGKVPGGLVTDGEYRRISADTILLVCVSKERKEFAFTAISPGTMVKYGETTKCLSDIFEDDGLDALIETVHGLVNIPIDRYAMVSLNEFPDIIDIIGGVDFNVPCDMVYDDYKGGLHINITAGLQELDGKTALEVLRFDKYENTTGSRLKTTIAFAKAVMSKMTDSELMFIRKAGAIFNEAKQMVVTDFTAADLNSNLDLIFSYPDFTPVSLELPGTYSTIEGRLCFIPNTNACRNTLAPYRRIQNG